MKFISCTYKNISTLVFSIVIADCGICDGVYMHDDFAIRQGVSANEIKRTVAFGFIVI